MIDIFDRLGAELNDIIGSHENNTAGWAAKELKGYADGGEVSDDSPTGLIRELGNAAKPLLNRSGSDSALGQQSSYNSPVFLASHYTQLGKFFNTAESGNQYTNRYKQPEQTKPTQAESPNDFYARFYAGMRRFAEAREIADAGNVTVRSR